MFPITHNLLTLEILLDFWNKSFKVNFKKKGYAGHLYQWKMNSAIYFPLRKYHLWEHSILLQTIHKPLVMLYKKHLSTLSNTEQQLGVIQSFQQSSWEIWKNWREKKLKKALAVCDQHGRENQEVFSVVRKIESLSLRKSASSEVATRLS